jgi:hypothetical protein
MLPHHAHRSFADRLPEPRRFFASRRPRPGAADPADRRANRPGGDSLRVASGIPRPSAGGLSSRWAALGRARYVLVSLLLLVPCFWQSRLQAGDLSSHIYNSWLAQLIQDGRAPGLAVVRQTTNVLFDLLLSALFSAFGAEAAQRVAVSLAVLIFVWGAFAFAGAVAERRAWHVLPLLAMIAYGWVFHMGFFNFYLSMGLCCWAMALAWSPTPARLAAAAALGVLAYTAHALPLVWAAGLMAYAFVARRLAPNARARLTAAIVLGMAAGHLAARQFVLARWTHRQWAQSTGVDQLWLYDAKYYVAMTALLMVEALLFLRLARRQGARSVFTGVPFHLTALAAAAVFVLPTAIQIPGYAHLLAYIAERLSLGVGVCACALLAAAEPRRVDRYALAAAVLLYFGIVYRDERVLNAFEDRMRQTVAAVPDGGRVISLIFGDYGLRANPAAHIIDRVCLGRCYSYGNYEPSTRQFRIHGVAPNPIVTVDYGDSFQMQIGGYVVKERDVPLYAVDISPDGGMRLVSLPAGYRTGVTLWDILADAPPQ